MKTQLSVASLLLRLALSATFLSAVSSRLGFWGDHSSGWQGFLEYAAAVNSFAPKVVVPFLAVFATVLEVIIAILLLIGYKIRWAAYGSCVLTLLFALAMSWSFGVKDPLDYSVFVDSAASLLLATVASDYWSLDGYLANKKSKREIINVADYETTIESR